MSTPKNSTKQRWISWCGHKIADLIGRGEGQARKRKSELSWENQKIEQQAIFGQILDRSLNEFYIVDAETFHFLQVNQSAIENLGYTMEELRALTPLDIKPEHTHALVSEMIAPLRAGTKDSVDFTTVHRRKDGTEYPVQIQLETSVLGDQPVFAAVVLDITEKRMAEERLREIEFKSHTLLDSSPVCTKVIDLDSRLQYMSAAGAEMLKIDNIEQFYGETYPPRIWTDSQRAPLVEHLNRALAGEVSSVECLAPDADGCEICFRATFTPVWDDNERIEYIIVSSVEITHEKKAEAELIAAKNAAVAANLAKSEFLANMSHEIRTPMTAILGFTDILLDNVVSPEDIESARTVKENGEYLLNLINDILDLSKIESGNIEVEHIASSPHQIISDVVSLMREKAKSKGLPLNVQFDGPVPETICTDPTRLRQVLINVMGNAIKFTETGSVQMVTRLLNNTDKVTKLQIDVIDTGIGIPADKIEQIFNPFTQADGSTTRTFGGTGLGLSISKRLVELLGGELTVSSTAGKGSVFSIMVSTGPLDNVRLIQDVSEAGVETKDEIEADNTGLSLSNRRILLTEDGPDNQRLIGFILKKAGADVTLADNGQIGLELATAAKIEGRPFDVLLMDMQMPVLDGYSATRQLRENGYTLPIIALTAHAMASDRQKCLDAGCDDYTTKPIDRKKLIELVASYAKREEVVEAG